MLHGGAFHLLLKVTQIYTGCARGVAYVVVIENMRKYTEAAATLRAENVQWVVVETAFLVA